MKPVPREMPCVKGRPQSRVLIDMGYMRELGEGVPRMFEVMEREGLRQPEFRMEGGAIFTVILRNTPVYSPDTLQWLKQFEGQRLNPDQKRLLAYSHSHAGRFTSRVYQKLVGVDIYTASKDIKDLIRQNIVRPIKKGGRIYEVFPSDRQQSLKPPDELQRLRSTLKQKGYLKNEDVRKVLGINLSQANRLLRGLTETGWLRGEGDKRGRRYYLNRNIEQA